MGKLKMSNKSKELSGVALAGIVAVATFAGGATSSIVDKILVDPNVAAQIESQRELAEEQRKTRLRLTALELLNKPPLTEEGYTEGEKARRVLAVQMYEEATGIKYSEAEINSLIASAPWNFMPFFQSAQDFRLRPPDGG